MPRYSYYVEGTKIALLELNSDGYWKSPATAVTNGIIMEFTPTLASPTTETDNINVSRTLAMAIIDYLRFRKNQDNDPKLAEYFRSEFYKKTSREKNRVTGTGRRAIPRGKWVLK